MSASVEYDPNLALLSTQPPDNVRNFGGSRALFRAAAGEFGVDLTTQEDMDWLYLLGAGMLVDHLVDVERTDIVQPFKDMLAGNTRPDLKEKLQLNTVNYMQRQPQERMDFIFSCLGRVSELAVAQRQATSARQVVGIRTAEADIFSSLLALPAEDKPDSDARTRFNLWLRGWSRTGYLFDSLVDLKSDYENDESGVIPTAKARATLALATSKEAAAALKRTPARLIEKCAINGIRYTIRNKHVNVAQAV